MMIVMMIMMVAGAVVGRRIQQSLGLFVSIRITFVVDNGRRRFRRIVAGKIRQTSAAAGAVAPSHKCAETAVLMMRTLSIAFTIPANEQNEQDD